MSVTHISIGHSFENANCNVRNTHNSSLITHNSIYIPSIPVTVVYLNDSFLSGKATLNAD